MRLPVLVDFLLDALAIAVAELSASSDLVDVVVVESYCTQCSMHMIG